MWMNKPNRLALFCCLLSAPLWAQSPVELGSINWLRNYEEATQRATKNSQPICLLFQEVPGCSGCQKYGREVLNNPLIRSAIEEQFVPLAIHNNKGGEDQRILKRFKEPAWNYQVMRFVDTSGADLIPRKDKVWTTHGTASRLILAIEAAKRPVPAYLTLLRDSSAPGLKTAVVSMPCYYVGEAKLGALEGVVGTESGWYDRHEVVKVRYDPAQISLNKLLTAANAVHCANRVYLAEKAEQEQATSYIDKPVSSFNEAGYRRAEAREQHVHLRRLRSVDALKLSPAQATKVNSAIAAGASVTELSVWLTADQRTLLSPAK